MFHFGLEPYIPIVIYVGAIIVFLLSIIGRPIAGLLFLLPLLPLQTVRTRVWMYPFGQYLIDFILLGVLFGLATRGRLRFPKALFGRLIVVYVIFTYVSLFWGAIKIGAPLPFWFDDTRMSDWHSLMLMPVLFYAAYSCINIRMDVIALIVAMSIGALGLASSFRRNSVTGQDFSNFSYSLRSNGTVGYAGVNGLAALMVQYGVFVAAIALVERNLVRKVFFAVVAAGCIFCVLYALSRGAYAALLIAWVYFSIARRQFYLLVPLVLFALTWQWILPGAVVQRVMNTVNQEGELESSAEGRVDVWEDTIPMIASNPIFGSGFLTFFYMRSGEHLRDTHNLYLKLLAETGLVGTILFLAIWFLVYREGVKLYQISTDHFFRAISLGFTGFMVCVVIVNLFGDRWFYMQVSGFTFALFAIVARCHDLLEEDPNALGIVEKPKKGFRPSLSSSVPVPTLLPSPAPSPVPQLHKDERPPRIPTWGRPR